jgi:hypothetical protein
LICAAAQQKRLIAVVGGGEAERFADRIIKATRLGEIDDDDACVIEHGWYNKWRRIPVPGASGADGLDRK